MKPVVDRVVAAVLLSLLALPMLTIMLVIALSSGSPTLFRQARVGRNGAVFTIFKFRTMRPDRRSGTDRRRSPRAEAARDRRERHKSTSDPRVTSFGRLLRKTSLDELPQLWNVLRGDMSLVGPRPELVEIVERHYAPWQLMRHAVKPGITGPWQVSDRQHGVMYEDSHLDIAYVHSVSLRVDVTLLLRTAWMLITRATGF